MSVKPTPFVLTHDVTDRLVPFGYSGPEAAGAGPDRSRPGALIQRSGIAPNVFSMSSSSRIVDSTTISR